MINKLRKAAEAAYSTGQDVQVNPGLILGLLDKLEAAEKDAARYRWMKEADIPMRYKLQFYTAAALDEFIDAEMGEQK